MDAAEVVRRRGGLATRHELLEHVTARELVASLDAGEVVRVARGRYALPVMHEAKVAAVRVGGVISHLSAALLWGWPVKTPPEQPTVSVPRGRNLSAERREGIDVRYAVLSQRELDGGVTNKVRTVIDCAHALPFDEALAVADSALRAGVSRRALLAAALESRRTGRPAVLRVIRAEDGRAMNPFESVLRALAIEAGLVVVPQLRCTDYLRVDVGCADLRLALEARVLGLSR